MSENPQVGSNCGVQLSYYNGYWDLSGVLHFFPAQALDAADHWDLVVAIMQVLVDSPTQQAAVDFAMEKPAVLAIAEIKFDLIICPV